MAQKKQSSNYWEERAEQRLVESELISKKHMKELSAVYNEAQRRTVEDIKKIYENYYKGVDGFDMQALRSIVPTGELKAFLREMKAKGISTNIPKNYKARITRQRLLNEQISACAKEIQAQEQQIDSRTFREVLEKSYYRSGSDIIKSTNASLSSFALLDEKTINQVMSTRFEGANYSQRIWHNTNILAKSLKRELGIAIATGQSVEKTARKIRERFGVGKYYAERLIRTETNHFHNAAEIESYRELGVEYFQFLATLDSRTSEICQHMDGRKFKVSEAKPGENYPPLHPNCRSTTIAVIDGFELKERIYRDNNNKNNYANIKFYKQYTSKTDKFKNPYLWGINSIDEKINIVKNHKLSKEFLNNYFDSDTSAYKFSYMDMDKYEESGLRAIIQKLNPGIAVRLPEVKIPKGINMPDFYIDGVLYEVKSPSTERAIDDRLRKAKKQILSDGVTVLDMGRSKISEKVFIKSAKERAKQRSIENLIITKDGEIIFEQHNKKQ